MGLVEKFGKKTLISAAATLIVSLGLIGGGAGIIDGNDGYEDDYSPSSKETLSIGERIYVTSGTKYFSFYSNSSGCYRVNISNINDVYSFSVYTSSGDHVNAERYSLEGCYEVDLNSYTSYDI